MVALCCTIKGKDTRYKLYWPRNDLDTVGVGEFVAEEWIEKVFEVLETNRIILVKFIVGHHVVSILCVNAQQSGLVIGLRTCSLISWVL